MQGSFAFNPKDTPFFFSNLSQKTGQDPAIIAREFENHRKDPSWGTKINSLQSFELKNVFNKIPSFSSGEAFQFLSPKSESFQFEMKKPNIEAMAVSAIKDIPNTKSFNYSDSSKQINHVGTTFLNMKKSREISEGASLNEIDSVECPNRLFNKNIHRRSESHCLNPRDRLISFVTKETDIQMPNMIRNMSYMTGSNNISDSKPVDLKRESRNDFSGSKNPNFVNSAYLDEKLHDLKREPRENILEFRQPNFQQSTYLQQKSQPEIVQSQTYDYQTPPNLPDSNLNQFQNLHTSVNDPNFLTQSYVPIEKKCEENLVNFSIKPPRIEESSRHEQQLIDNKMNNINKEIESPTKEKFYESVEEMMENNQKFFTVFKDFIKDAVNSKMNSQGKNSLSRAKKNVNEQETSEEYKQTEDMLQVDADVKDIVPRSFVRCSKSDRNLGSREDLNSQYYLTTVNKIDQRDKATLSDIKPRSVQINNDMLPKNYDNNSQITQDEDIKNFFGKCTEDFDKFDFMKKNLSTPATIDMSHRKTCPENIMPKKKNKSNKKGNNFKDNNDLNIYSSNVQFPPKPSINNLKNTPKNDKQHKNNLIRSITQLEKRSTTPDNDKSKNMLNFTRSFTQNPDSNMLNCDNNLQQSSRKTYASRDVSSISGNHSTSCRKLPDEEIDNSQFFVQKETRKSLAIPTQGRDRRVKRVEQIDIDQVKKVRKFPEFSLNENKNVNVRNSTNPIN